MLSVGELYYLNKALDGKEIYGVNPSGEILFRNSKTVIESLIEKEILKEDGSLNELSFMITRNLEQYKKASSYLLLNEVLFSMDDSNYLIFSNKKENGNLDFRKTTKEIMLLTIIKEYEFLWNYKEVNGNKEKMPLDIFLNGTISKKEENQVLYIKKEREKKPFLYNVYFTENGLAYKYDVINEEICEMNPKKIRNELAEIFELKEG